MEVLPHGGATVGGGTAKQIHDAIPTSFQLSAARYGLNQLRYDLRKMKAHGLLERDGKRHAYRPTGKGLQAPSPLCFFTSAYAAPLQTASFTTSPIARTGRTVNSKPPVTKPTQPSVTLSNCWRPLEVCGPCGAAGVRSRESQKQELKTPHKV